VLADIEDLSVAELVGDLQPKGFSRAVRVHNVRDLDHRQVER
jgi:adenylate cyclase